MSCLNQKMVNFCRDAYVILKNDTSELACWVTYDKHNSRNIEFMMQKSSYHFGRWALFDGGVYVTNIDEELLKSWTEAKQEGAEA